MKAIISVVIISTVLLNLHAVKPPVWAPVFRQSFVESYTSNKNVTVGQLWYDSIRVMSRLDRTNGQNQGFCSSILPGVTTPCTQLVRDSKRYVIFPQRRQCCVCCDAAHGCGILKRDWLSTATYLGRQTLSGQQFDKWSIPDGDSLDYYWATTDDKQIQRKMSQVGSRIKDFLMNTYSESPIPDSVFALPSFCSNAPNCPDTSVCRFFRNSLQSQ